MSASSKPRIKRGSGPSAKLSDHNVRRRALPHLLEDFEHRCAYSMRHVQIAGGLRHMDIDHFDPTLRAAARNAYSNLMLATHHVNIMKIDWWPNEADAAAGKRLLNPTKEPDYGKHLFEDPQTHELVGVTPAGKYHIDMLDLNHDTFVWERSKRAHYVSLALKSPARLSGTFDELRDLLDLVHNHFDLFIPSIPPPPG